MDKLIKTLIFAIPLVIVSILGLAGYGVYRIVFYQEPAETTASVTSIQKQDSASGITMDWNQAKQSAQAMKQAFFNAAKPLKNSTDSVMEAEKTWQTMVYLEQKGTRLLEKQESKFMDRLQTGSRSQQQHDETLTSLGKQYNLAMLYIYAHLWPVTLEEIAKKTLNLYDPSATKKLGTDWMTPLPLDHFRKEAANCQVWPPKDNLISREFGETTSANIFSE
ncbi:MAG: hypothetical protein AABZ44_10060 [Elusimicrobiota bacterium]